MKKHPEERSAKIELVPATPEHAPILENLLELYIHDFSEFLDIEIGSDGRFGYKHLSSYWADLTRHAFLIRVDSRLAGFVLVKTEPAAPGREAVWDLAEFFTLRRYRNRGIGTRAAHAVWNLLPGPWQVRVMESNTQAHHFWSTAISRYCGKSMNFASLEKDGQRWRVFTFESRHAE